MRQVIDLLFARTLILLALAACTTEDAFEASTGESPAEYIARLCKENMLDCQKVYAFEAPADNDLGQVELCVREDDLPLAESMFGAYELSPHPRFDLAYSLGIGPVCYWHCTKGPGCNALGDGNGHSCFNCASVP